jgi:site-specific recombinase XerD
VEPSAPDPEVEGFLALLATRRAPKTVDAYRRDLAALAAWLDRPVGQMTTEQLEQYLAELRAAGLSPSTIARRVAAIRSFFRHQALLGARCRAPFLPRRPSGSSRPRTGRRRALFATALWSSSSTEPA